MPSFRPHRTFQKDFCSLLQILCWAAPRAWCLLPLPRASSTAPPPASRGLGWCSQLFPPGQVPSFTTGKRRDFSNPVAWARCLCCWACLIWWNRGMRLCWLQLHVLCWCNWSKITPALLCFWLVVVALFAGFVWLVVWLLLLSGFCFCFGDLFVCWVFFIGFSLIWKAWRREQKLRAERQANRRAWFRKCTSFSKTVIKCHWEKAGSGEPEGALPAPLGSGKGHRSAPQPTVGLEPQWRMVEHWTFQRLLRLGRQQLQPGLFWPADLCLSAGQAVTHCFWRALTFFT